MHLPHENRKMQEKLSADRPGNQDAEECDVQGEIDKTSNAAHHISTSCEANATIHEIAMHLPHENRKMQEKLSADRPGNQDVEPREAQMRKIAYLALDRSRARKHRATCRKRRRGSG